MRGRAVPRWEAFSRDDERCRVRAEVEEKLAQHVEPEECAMTEVMVGETNHDEQYGEYREAHKLNGFPSDGVNSSTAKNVS